MVERCKILFLDAPDADPDARAAATREAAQRRLDGGAPIALADAIDRTEIAAIVHADALNDRAIAAALERLDVPAIVFAGDRRTDSSLRTFRLGGDPALEIECAVRHLRVHKISRWAVLVEHAPPGRLRAAAARRAIGELGGVIAAEHEFASGDPRFETGLAGAARAGVQAVFLTAAPNASAARAALAQAALLAMRRCRLPGLLHLSGSFAGEETVAQALGRDGAGAIAASYGTASQRAAAAIRLIAELIEQVGPEPRRLAAALAGLRDHPSPLGPITFDERGDNVAATHAIHVIDDGRWLRWEASDYALRLNRLPGVLG